MAKKKKDGKKLSTFIDAALSIRRTWGSFSPITHIKGSKKAEDSKRACRGKAKLPSA